MVLPIPITILRILGLFFLCHETPKFYLRKIPDLQIATSRSKKVLERYYEPKDCEEILKIEIECLKDEKLNSPSFSAMFSKEYRN